MLQTAKRDIVRASTTGKSSRSHRDLVHMQESKSRAEKEFRKKKKGKKEEKPKWQWLIQWLIIQCFSYFPLRKEEFLGLENTLRSRRRAWSSQCCEKPLEPSI